MRSPVVRAAWDGFPGEPRWTRGAQELPPPLPSTRRRSRRGPARPHRPLQSPAPVTPTRRCWPRRCQPQAPLPPPPWRRRRAPTGQPRPQCGPQGHSRVPPQPQTQDPALVQPAQPRGPVRSCGLPDVAQHQGSRYPAPALAAASVSPAFGTWHSIFVRTAPPHSPWKASSSAARPRAAPRASPACRSWWRTASCTTSPTATSSAKTASCASARTARSSSTCMSAQSMRRAPPRRRPRPWTRSPQRQSGLRSLTPRRRRACSSRCSSPSRPPPRRPAGPSYLT